MKSRAKIHSLIIIAFLVCSCQYGFAQEEIFQKVAFNKNAVYGSLGKISFLGDSYKSRTLFFERMIKQKMWNKNISSFVKVGYGKATLDGEYWFGGGTYKNEGQFLLAQYGLIFGAKTHHLELGLGLTRFISGTYESEGTKPSVTVGWRIQAPGENFIFRLGFSAPEGFYIGVGFSF